MTKEQVIALAQHCGLPDPMVFYAAYERFAKLVSAAERDFCAKLCDKLQQQWRPAGECADAIRARGNT
jgi:hypothetical protein